jgi:hypothetical protein
MTSSDIKTLIKQDTWMMEILEEVELLNLPDWWIGAGFVRGKVWDYLHGFKNKTDLPDIDIIYFDPKGNNGEDEKKIWVKLKAKHPQFKWSVTNTAFRHLKRESEPYKSSSDCLAHWVETATCIGVSLKNGKLFLTAPHGIEDLVNLIVRSTEDFKDGKEMQKRIKEKQWLIKWPKLKVVRD